jgi:hypothetical protein
VKIQFAALPLLAALAAPAFAGRCVALDYQEMKDMSADQLLDEACKARVSGAQSYDEKKLNLDARGGRQPFPNAQENFDQCIGQISRIDRVLESKGLTKEKVIDVCQARKANGSR